MDNTFIADQDAFKYLLLARRYLGSSSYREVVGWLNVKFKSLELPCDMTGK